MKKRNAFNLIKSSFLMIYYDTRVIDNQLSNITLIDNEKKVLDF